MFILQFTTSSLLLCFFVRYFVDFVVLCCLFVSGRFVLSSSQPLFIALAICMFTQMSHDWTRASGGCVDGSVNVVWWFCVNCSGV